MISFWELGDKKQEQLKALFDVTQLFKNNGTEGKWNNETPYFYCVAEKSKKLKVSSFNFNIEPLIVATGRDFANEF